MKSTMGATAEVVPASAPFAFAVTSSMTFIPATSDTFAETVYSANVDLNIPPPLMSLPVMVIGEYESALPFTTKL